ncbi:MAG: YraN family protein [Clostridia bacterium]|nr:YraN family protein [Clostridia bacterium]
MNNREFGYFGETVAADFLIKKGYKIADRNYYVVGGELDIVAYNDKTLVFCEVKTRYNGSSLRFGRPAAAVDYRKQSAVSAAAKQYLFDHPTKLAPRIDVIEVIVSTHEDVNGKPWYFIDEINHIENAVLASQRTRFSTRDKRFV